MSEDVKRCKACDMPIRKDKEFGTNADGSRNEDYCIYCMNMGKETKICQSCGMPLMKEEDFGTEADGSKNEDYCLYCYKDGKFTNPEATLYEVIELNIQVNFELMNEDGTVMTDDQKRAMMKAYLPTLKRWKQ